MGITSMSRIRGALHSRWKLFLLVLLTCQPAYADFDGRFPGKGTRESFAKAGALHKQARIAQRTGELKKAEKLFRQAIAVYPYEPGLFYNLGHCFLDQKRYHEAESAFIESIKLQERFENNIALAAALYHQSKDSDAKKYILRAQKFARTEAQKKMAERDLARITQPE